VFHAKSLTPRRQKHFTPVEDHSRGFKHASSV
jgi:hypothetical protein